MTTDDPIKAAQSGVALLGEVIKAAGDSPNVKAAGNELGKAALTLTKTINNALLPLAAVNFAFEKARQYFSKRFAQDLEEKASTIPADLIVEPKASIAGPALQGLAFSHGEPNLKEMYLSLLASAMDGRSSEKVHPAFVEIIRQLNSEEARLLRGILRSRSGIPIAETRLQLKNQGFRVLHRNLLNLRQESSGEPAEDPQLSAMVDNWVRLGLVTVDFTKQVADEKAYDWVESRPEFKRQQSKETEEQKVAFSPGVIECTSLGQQFASVVGLLDGQSTSSSAQPPKP